MMATPMPTYSAAEVRSEILRLVSEAGLSWEQFLAMGADDELCEVSADLDFAYRALVPSLFPES